MRVSVLSSTDPLLRSITALSLSDICPILTVDLDEDGTTLTYSTGFDESTTRVPLAHSCITCSLREAIIPFLLEREPENVVVVLPPTIESATVVPRFADDVAGLGWEVSSAVHVCDLATIADELLSHVTLEERGLAFFEGDERCVGEIQLVGIGYSDVIVAVGDDDAALELVEHFRPHDSLLVRSLADIDAETLCGRRHDVDAAIARIHPATTAAWGGPTEHGMWTLDLHSDRAFHPERFLDAVSELCQGDVCVRGCFWLPTRPDTVCALNAHGGIVSVGGAGEWEESPHTHLIVTGSGDVDQQTIIELAFVACLLSPDEQRESVAWAGLSDGFDDWFE